MPPPLLIAVLLAIVQLVKVMERLSSLPMPP